MPMAAMTDDRRMALPLLQGSPWLKRYPLGLAEALVAEGTLQTLDEGRWVHSAGDEGNGLVVVIEGSLDLFCDAPGERTVRIGQAGAGAAMGHAVRYGGGPRLVTAICAEPSLLLRISEVGLERVARTRPDIWQAVTALLYLQLQYAIQIGAETIALPPRQRIASRLLLFARGRAAPIYLALSQQALSEMVGLTRKTVNVHLGRFQRDGLIRLEYGRIWLTDMERLRKIVES